MRLRFARHLGGLSVLQAQLPLVQLHGAEAFVSEAPELPPEFSWHDYAIFLLSTAAEIEHSLMVQYLYAAYSVGGPEVPEDKRCEVFNWQQTILGIAKEEMGHLVTVQNVLKLLGGALHLDREDYPWVSGFYPYAFTLEGLSRKSLAKYVIAESPKEWPSSVTSEERKTIEDLAQQDGNKPVMRVGQLYQTLIDVLSDPMKIPDAQFRAETYPFQASWDEWGRGYAKGARGSTPQSAPNVLILRASSRTEAIGALTAVAEQGEAVEASAGSPHSHFWRFLEVYRAFSKVTTWSPTLPVAQDPRAPGLGAGAEGTIIEHPEAILWAGLFNLRYRMLLAYLAHAFQLSDDPAQSAAPGRRGQVVNHVFSEMYNLKAVAGLLIQLPLKDDPKKRAGPPFQMPYALNFPAAETDFWRLHLDLIDAAAAQLSRLDAATHGPGRAYAEALRKLDQQTRHEIDAISSPAQATSRFLRSTGSVR
jgi:hypothetical protein